MVIFFLSSGISFALIDNPYLRQIVPTLPNRHGLSQIAQVVSWSIRDEISRVTYDATYATVQLDGWTDRVNRRFIAILLTYWSGGEMITRCTR
jgi:hypothetical protein